MSPKSRSPGDRALGRGGRGRADEQVVVVGVVVDHAPGKLRQPRPNGRFEETHEGVDELAAGRIGDRSRVAGDDVRGAFGVPGEVAADGRRMREARERDVEPAEEMACALEDRRVARRGVRENRSRQPREEPRAPVRRRRHEPRHGK